MKKHKLTALATTALTFGIIAAPLANIKSANAGYMDDYFRNGMTIKLVTPKGFNVNLPYPTNGGMINTFEPDKTDDWKFVVIRSSTDGFKLKRVGTNHLITAKSFPAQNLTPLQAWQDVGGEDKTQTWVATPTRPGFFAICLKAQRDQCMNVPNSTNRTKLTTYKFNANDQDQMFSAVSISSSTPNPGTPDFTLSVYRQDNPFWRSGYAPKSTNPPFYSMGNPNAKGNCTWYANGRAKQLGRNAARVDKMTGNASQWDDQARAAGIGLSRTPQVGAIAQWETNHVAVVERVNSDGTILISESSYSDQSGTTWDYLYKTRTISASVPSTFILP